MLDRSRHGQLAAGEPRFADAVDAFVGIYDHKQKVSLPAPYRVCLDTGYLHTYLQVPLPNDGTRDLLRAVGSKALQIRWVVGPFSRAANLEVRASEITQSPFFCIDAAPTE